MTPIQKLKWAVLADAAKWAGADPPPYPCPEVDALYEALVDEGNAYDSQDEVRTGGIDTDLPAPWSSHFESKARAMQMPDGSWVGWTYWYGGGKHASPQDIDWMSDAYDVQCSEEEKLVVVRTWSKPAKEAVSGPAPTPY